MVITGNHSITDAICVYIIGDSFSYEYRELPFLRHHSSGASIYTRSFTIIDSTFYFLASAGRIAVAQFSGSAFELVRTIGLEDYMACVNDIFFSTSTSAVYLTFTHRLAEEKVLPGSICVIYLKRYGVDSLLDPSLSDNQLDCIDITQYLGQ